ncbi:MAG: hypothetical protein WBN40_11165, partial [Pseudomonadales bacterium]
NDSIDMIYGYSTALLMTWAVVLTLVGLATISVFIGILLVPLGLYLFYKGYQHMQAYKMMAA